MHYLIDGYNLLHVTNVFVEAVGAKSVSVLHARFLDDLAGLLTPEECRHTTIVFDAKGRRAAERRTGDYSGMTVHYAARTEDADTMIAELLQEYHSPRQLTVVSSDHQVQRAAKRRRAKAVDSEVWYAAMQRRRREQMTTSETSADAASTTEISDQDADWWLAQFDAELLKELKAEEHRSVPKPHDLAEPVHESAAGESPDDAVSSREEKKEGRGEVYRELANPFPAEYLAEVAREIKNELAQPKPSSKAITPKKRSRKRG